MILRFVIILSTINNPVQAGWQSLVRLHSTRLHSTRPEVGKTPDTRSPESKVPGAATYVPFSVDQGLPIKIDEFSGLLSRRQRERRLDRFVRKLEGAPSATGVLYVYGGIHSRPRLTDAIVRHALTYLTKQRNIDPCRMTVSDGGLSKRFTVELYLIPQGVVALAPRGSIVPKHLRTWPTLCKIKQKGV